MIDLWPNKKSKSPTSTPHCSHAVLCIAIGISLCLIRNLYLPSWLRSMIHHLLERILMRNGLNMLISGPLLMRYPKESMIVLCLSAFPHLRICPTRRYLYCWCFRIWIRVTVLIRSRTLSEIFHPNSSKQDVITSRLNPWRSWNRQFALLQLCN